MVSSYVMREVDLWGSKMRDSVGLGSEISSACVYIINIMYDIIHCGNCMMVLILIVNSISRYHDYYY